MASQRDPAFGHSIRQEAGPLFAMWNKWLGDQWTIGDWAGMRAAAPQELPAHLAFIPWPDDPPQNLREYDPEWGRAFVSGTVAASCDHARMLAAVNVPVLLTHHFRLVDPATGLLIGALSDLPAERARAIVTSAGQSCEYRTFPEMGHSMHGQDPALFARTLTGWAASLASR